MVSEFREHPVLRQYVSMLIKWNQVYNLIGRQTEDEVWDNHIADSLMVLEYFRKCPQETVIDIGTGAGLPGIPLSVFLPEKQFLLTDVNSKKLAFLSLAARTLGINARAVDIRAPFQFNESCIITSRAYGSLKLIKEWSALHAPSACRFILLKGQEENALREIEEAGETAARLEPLQKGCVVIVEK